MNENAIAAETAGRKLYRAGTLTYTPLQLVGLFAFLLTGGFCLSFIGAVQGGGLFTLSLNRFHADPVFISVVLGSIPAALNMIVCPIVSFRSDRTRSRWGRRKPYILISVPFIALAIVGVGWAPYFVSPVSAMTGLSANTVGLGLCGMFIVAYSFFTMFVGSVYYYLYADVVPESLIGRFNSAFYLVGSGAGVFFNFAIRDYVTDYLPWIYTFVALVVFIGFLIMCLMVREGEYPPVKEELSPLKAAYVYFRECFASDSFYWWFFTATAMNEVSVLCRSLYNILFATQELSIPEKSYFEIMGYTGILSLVVLLPLGFLVDYFRPIRIYVTGMLLVIATNIYGFFFCHDYLTFMIISFSLTFVYCIQNASTLPLFIELLPKDRYGQFCSAQAIFRSVIMFLANGVAGFFILWMGSYRYIFVWDAIFTILATAAMVMVFRGWYRNGGPKGYVAPR